MKIFSNFLHGFCSLFRGNVHNGFMPFKMLEIPQFPPIPQLIRDGPGQYLPSPTPPLPHFCRNPIERKGLAQKNLFRPSQTKDLQPLPVGNPPFFIEKQQFLSAAEAVL
jgi:hypothetical protein